MKLSLGFSPCPNDTFIFDAMIHGKIDTEGIDFEVIMADVEELNRLAFEGKIDITKLSYHAFAHLLGRYSLLDAGSALGNNCGPLLIAREQMDENQVKNARIAIPGKFTTANFLLGLAYPEAQNKEEILFSDIEKAVLEGDFDAGLIIHENRFTYAEKGLVKIQDLGEFWEQKTGLPIPLGGIVVNQNLPFSLKEKINRILAKSVTFAFENPKEALPFIREHAQEMDESVMYAHIGLYVNEYTKNLGENGKKAVRHLFEMARDKELIGREEKPVFWDE
ncbi:MAG: 1,4-dihydroxy-6-naphthoate synthase [Saprospiraceae bacterium]|nr:1,4-dihydroxy-6-naphthoate synthase [Saprospiraceae bacterium]MCB9323422.1 1,4-dihydroxy-6-naphthoate synthase [Lewinellaceae bacterium]